MVIKSLINNIEINSIENIKEALIKSCLLSKPAYFKPYLLSEKVLCEPDKPKFYELFKYMIRASRMSSEGELYLKIVSPNPENLNIQRYEFYDTKHLHSRLTILLEENENTIHLDILPF